MMQRHGTPHIAQSEIHVLKLPILFHRESVLEHLELKSQHPSLSLRRHGMLPEISVSTSAISACFKTLHNSNKARLVTSFSRM